MTKAALPLVALLALAAPASARDSLGVYSNWAAFRDDSPSRCYAIAKPSRQSETQPFASIATWPQKGLRGQLYVRLSRETEEKSNPRLTIGDAEFELVAQGRNAWARDKAMDAAIIAALRSASRMTITAQASNGSRFSDRYSLAGVATAMDAAVVGCAS